jgi:protoheme ferro-lyase
MKKGLLFIHLGTPNLANVAAIRRYLWECLLDPRVLSLPAFFRFALHCFMILFFFFVQKKPCLLSADVHVSHS